MSRSPRGLGSVYKERSPDRRTAWRAERWVTLPDGTVKRAVGRGKTEAEAIRRRAQKEAELARAHPDAARLTVSAFLTRWLESKGSALKPNTLREYQRIVQHTNRVIGDVPLARVTPLHIQRVMDAHQPATANAIRRYLRGAFRQAERWELLALSPVRNIEPVRRTPTVRRVLQPEEIQPFLDAAPSGYRALFTVAVFAGLRRGELLALPWGNVSETTIVVDRTWTRGGVVGTPKTHASYRTVPIHPSVYKVIVDGRAGRRDSPLAFPPRHREGAMGDEMLGGGNLWRAFDATIGKSGVKRLRFHDLRRTAATLWARQGQPPTAIQRLLGHSTPHLALAVYNDVMRGQLESAALNPADFAGGGIGGLKMTTDRTRGAHMDSAAAVDDPQNADNPDVHQ